MPVGNPYGYDRYGPRGMVPDHSPWGVGIISDHFAVDVVGTGHALSCPAPSTMSQGNSVVIYGYSIRRFTVGWGHYIRRFAVGQDRACPVPTVRGLLWCAYRCTGYGWTSGVGLRVLAPGCWCTVQTVGCLCNVQPCTRHPPDRQTYGWPFFGHLRQLDSLKKPSCGQKMTLFSHLADPSQQV